MVKLNSAHIVKASVFRKLANWRYEWREETTFLWMKWSDAGYYYIFTIGSPEMYTVEQIEEEGTMFCEDKKVYYKPHIDFKTTDDKTVTKYFDTVEEMEALLETPEMKEIKWIEI